MTKETKQESVRLSVETIEFVEGLAKLGIYAKRKGAIFRYFIQEGVNRAISDDVISKYLAAKERIREINDQA